MGGKLHGPERLIGFVHKDGVVEILFCFGIMVIVFEVGDSVVISQGMIHVVVVLHQNLAVIRQGPFLQPLVILKRFPQNDKCHIVGFAHEGEAVHLCLLEILVQRDLNALRRKGFGRVLRRVGQDAAGKEKSHGDADNGCGDKDGRAAAGTLLASWLRQLGVASDCHWQSFTTDPFKSSRSTQKTKTAPQMGCRFHLAEREGFEPSVGY